MFGEDDSFTGSELENSMLVDENDLSDSNEETISDNSEDDYEYQNQNQNALFNQTVTDQISSDEEEMHENDRPDFHFASINDRDQDFLPTTSLYDVTQPVLDFGDDDDLFARILWSIFQGKTHPQLLAEYVNLCKQRARNLEVAQQNIYDKRTSEFYSHSEEELKNIQLEYNSWLLISKLHEIHTNEENKDNFLQLKNKKNSENSDKRNERNRTILNWLENIYSSKLENRKTHLYTTPPNKDNLITPIQPPHSSSSSYPYDRYDEQELQLIWDSIRSGNFHTINQIASARNEYWRSSSLLGSSFVDLQFDSQHETGASWDGNPHRNLWKYCCWQLSNQPNCNQLEAAIYAAQCGNLIKMYPLCSSWDDFLWATFRVLVDSIDDKNRENIQTDTLLDDPKLPLQFGTLCLTIPDVFSQLQNQGKQPSINELKEEESTELEEIIEYYIDYLILQHKNEKKKQIKIANSKSKLTMEKARSVALYTSQIKNQAKQIEIYSNFLSEIEGDDENEKKMYWDFAIHAKLPCNVIANRIVEKKTNSNFVNSLASIQFQNKPSDDDLQRLYSLQWLCLHPSQRSDALLKANQLLSYFFLKDDLEKVNILVEKILPRTTLLEVEKKLTVDNFSLRNGCREFLCLDLLRNCLNCYSHWKSLIKPEQFTFREVSKQIKEAESVKSIHQASDKLENAIFNVIQFPYPRFPVSQEMRIHLRALELIEFVVHHGHSLNFNCDTCGCGREVNPQRGSPENSPLYDSHAAHKCPTCGSTLHAPQTGWLIDQFPSEAQDERNESVMEVRRHCLPTVVFMLVELYAYKNEHKKVMSVADVIVDDRWKLCETFSKPQLRDLLHSFRQSSTKILATSTDPLGFY